MHDPTENSQKNDYRNAARDRYPPGGLAPSKSPGTRALWGDTYENELMALRGRRDEAMKHLDDLTPNFRRAETVVAELNRAVSALENG